MNTTIIIAAVVIIIVVIGLASYFLFFHHTTSPSITSVTTSYMTSSSTTTTTSSTTSTSTTSTTSTSTSSTSTTSTASLPPVAYKLPYNPNNKTVFIYLVVSAVGYQFNYNGTSYGQLKIYVPAGCFVGYFRIIQKFINNYTEYYPWERVSTRGIGTSTTRTL